MKPTFDPVAHIYHDGRRVVPSVTGIMRAAGLSGNYEFRDRIHALRGTAVHQGSALIIAGGEPQLAPLQLPYSEREDYVRVHGEIPGYWDAMRAAKAAIKFTGAIYECPMVLPDSHAGTFDFAAYTDEYQLWDIKSGTFPVMTVVQVCAYEDLILRGTPIDENHPGLPWLREVLKSGRKLKRCGLRLEKTGRFTALYQCPKGRSYDDPMWMSVWKSALWLFNHIPSHEYEETDEYGKTYKRSHLSNLRWVAECIQEKLSGTAYDIAMQAGDNIYNTREAYGLL